MRHVSYITHHSSRIIASRIFHLGRSNANRFSCTQHTQTPCVGIDAASNARRVKFQAVRSLYAVVLDMSYKCLDAIIAHNLRSSSDINTLRAITETVGVNTRPQVRANSFSDRRKFSTTTANLFRRRKLSSPAVTLPLMVIVNYICFVHHRLDRNHLSYRRLLARDCRKLSSNFVDGHNVFVVHGQKLASPLLRHLLISVKLVIWLEVAVIRPWRRNALTPQAMTNVPRGNSLRWDHIRSGRSARLSIDGVIILRTHVISTRSSRRTMSCY